MAQPYAYVRKSRVFRDQRTISPEMQMDEVSALALRYGDTELVRLSDMNISGKKGRAKRPGFNSLLEALEAGSVSAIYSYSLSRLSRSVRDIVDLAELCAKQGVPIHLVVDPDPDPTSPSGKMILTILSAMAQFEADVASERARDTMEARRSRGEHLGASFYEATDAVVEAYQEAGSAAGAARLLTARGVPTRNGNAEWWATSVLVIIRRVAPDLLPVRRHRGVKRAAPFLFYRLLRCHCGHTLTAVRNRGKYNLYRCLRADHIEHGQKSVTETAILDWARAEAALLQPPVSAVALAEDTDAQRNALRDRVVRLGRAFVEGAVPEDEYAAEKASLDQQLERLDSAGRVLQLEPVAWDDEVIDINQSLRAMWHHVQLDEQMRPVFAEWTLPAWRIGSLAVEQAPVSGAARPARTKKAA